ncbi:hypothetical protein ANTQUA_LOCUS294 [Anthophora quadrimaculata]
MFILQSNTRTHLFALINSLSTIKVSVSLSNNFIFRSFNYLHAYSNFNVIQQQKQQRKYRVIGRKIVLDPERERWRKKNKIFSLGVIWKILAGTWKVGQICPLLLPRAVKRAESVSMLTAQQWRCSTSAKAHRTCAYNAASSLFVSATHRDLSNGVLSNLQESVGCLWVSVIFGSRGRTKASTTILRL